ncbi:MAG: hypothetical protein ACTSRK_19430 [Promethearchaeota archaeon]
MEKRVVNSERDQLRSLTEDFLSQNFNGEKDPSALHLTIFQKLRKKFGKNVEIDKIEIHKTLPQYYSFFPIMWGISISLMIIISIFNIWYLNLISSLFFLLIMVSIKKNPLLIQKFFFKSQKYEGKNFRTLIKSEKQENFDAKLAKILFITHYNSRFQLHQPRSYRFIIHLRATLTILVSAQLLLIGFFYNSYSPLLFVIHWVFVIFEGMLIVIVNLLIIYPKSDIQRNVRFDDALRTSFLINLHNRIFENEPKLTWCEIESVFLDAENDENQGSEHFFSKYAPKLSEYKDLYIIELDSLLFPIHLRQYSMTGEKYEEFNQHFTDLLKHSFLRQKIPLPQVNTRKSYSKLSLWIKNLPLSFSAQITNKKGNYKWISRQINEKDSFSNAKKLLEVFLDLVFFIDRAIDDHFQPDLE